MKLRSLVAQDLENVLEIEAGSPEAAQWSQKDYLALLQSGAQGWIVSGENLILGFLVMRRVADEIEILNLAVAASARRKGIGSLLLREALSWARQSWIASIHLEVRASNHAAREFYEAHGFRETGLRPRYYSDPPDDAVLLTCFVAEK